MRTRTVPVGSNSLSVTETGAGIPVVFLHAFPLHGRMWAAQLSALSDGWHGVAVDLRGFGRSPRGEVPARHVRDQAADVLALVEALAAGPAVLVGLSMGGYVAFECWRQRPSALRALVLADTRAEPDSEEARTRRTTMRARAAETGTAAVIDAMLPGLLGDRTRTDDPHVAVQVRGWALENEAPGVMDALEALRDRPDSRPTLPTITCPTLVIVGLDDTLTPPEAAAVIADGIRGAQLETIPAAGHLSSVEQPQAFNAAMTAWLARLRR